MYLSEFDIRNLIRISVDLTEGVAKKVMSRQKYQDRLFTKIKAEYEWGGLKTTKLKK